MLLGGDEFGRSQRGNNNAYCQDNELYLVRLEVVIDEQQRAVRVRQARAAPAPDPSGAAPRALLPGQKHHRHRAARHPLAAA